MNTKKTLAVLTAALSITALSSCRTGADAELQTAANRTAMSSSSGAMNTITDADAGAVAHTIDDGEIQLAQLAVSNASSQQVRDFAQMMITDHTNANQMLASAGFGMARNAMTDVLNAQVNRTMTMLRGKTGSDFDRAYIASQIDMHQTALESMRTTLIPSAQNRDLRQTLTNMRSSVQMHLDQARSIQGAIGK